MHVFARTKIILEAHMQIKRLVKLLVPTALCALLLSSTFLVAHAQDGAPDAGEAEGGVIIFLPTISTEPEFEGTPPVEPNPPTSNTIAANQAVYDELPFNDMSDFADVLRDLMAPLPDTTLADNARQGDLGSHGHMTSSSTGSDAPDSVNPSLWRQAQLVNTGGLFKVTDRLYQVRNYDLSNLTIIEGDTGIIVVDPLVSVETAAACAGALSGQSPAKDVVAVIYTHSHVDHWGGVLGVTTAEAVANGDVDIYAPYGLSGSGEQGERLCRQRHGPPRPTTCTAR